jgi:hypothetical protein
VRRLQAWRQWLKSQNPGLTEGRRGLERNSVRARFR